MPAQILHLLGTAQPEGSGIARIVGGLTGGLDPSKYRVHAWFLGSPGPLIEELQSAGATVRWVDWRHGALDPIGAYRFWRCLRDHDFAIVHQHHGARSIRRIIRLTSDARLVVHIHGNIWGPISAQRVPIAVRGADAVIAASRAIALKIPHVKTTVVHAGVESAMELHPEFKAARKSTVIGAACRLVPLKGLRDLIRAMASLCPEFPELYLEIAGNGPQREDLEREVDRFRLGERIRFLGWKSDLRTVFRDWDIFVLPSFDEGLPISVLEAMAEGLPVVATTVGGLPELIENGQSGYLVSPSDVSGLTQSLRILIQDSKRRQSMGAAARKRSIEHFSVHSMVEKIEAIYDCLTQQRRVDSKT